MTRDIAHDWEFLEDGRTIEPISVALTDGESHYYAVFDDIDVITAAARNTWLNQHVVRYLPVMVKDGLITWDANHPNRHQVKSREVIAADIRRYIGDRLPVALWGDHPSYDQVAMGQLYGRMIDMPLCIPQRTNDIIQLAESLGVTDLPDDNPMPHHSLSDARTTLNQLHYLRRLQSTR